MKFFPAAINLVLAAFFSSLFYMRYWKWHDCIAQAESSCVTPEGANLTSGGALWGGIAAIFLLSAVVSFYRNIRSS